MGRWWRAAEDRALRMARVTAVIVWALTVTVVFLVHGTVPHGAPSAAALASIQADHPDPNPCHAIDSLHGARSDPGDHGQSDPWGHRDAALHRTPSPPSGNGGHVLRGCSGAWYEETAAARSAAPFRAVCAAGRGGRRTPARLQVFRC